MAVTVTERAAGPVSAAREPAVRLDGVSKRFGAGPPVLDGISLAVAAGEFVCLLGASGCGKTTLLNVMAGLEPPSAGSVAVGGRPAVVFQETGLFPWLTAAQNVELALRLRHGPARRSRRERRARAVELLELVGLDGARDKRPHELSGGMRQRVAIARALAQDSSVLLMDEPFAALDAITRDLLHDELVALWRSAELTVMFVTHDVREAVRLAQRVLLLSSRPGRLAGSWDIALPHPRRAESPEVAQLAAGITGRLREEIRRHAEP